MMGFKKYDFDYDFGDKKELKKLVFMVADNNSIPLYLQMCKELLEKYSYNDMVSEVEVTQYFNSIILKQYMDVTNDESGLLNKRGEDWGNFWYGIDLNQIRFNYHIDGFVEANTAQMFIIDFKTKLYRMSV